MVHTGGLMSFHNDVFKEKNFDINCERRVGYFEKHDELEMVIIGTFR